MAMPKVLIISGGNAEDLIGATLAQHISWQRRNVYLAALPLVGIGRYYEGKVSEIIGPRLQMPSGGFPFNSLENLVADLRAGLIRQTFLQVRTAQLARRWVDVVVAVGDAYALAIGCVASGWGRSPLFHLQPQVSVYYWGERSLWERLKQMNQFGAEDYLFYERWMHRFVQAVYVRDRPSEERARQLGMDKAHFVGSMAMDVLGPPERDLREILDGRPVLVLLPGTRGDVRFSLPLMLESAALLPEMQGLVAWAGDFSSVPLARGWTLQVMDESTALACKGGHRVWLLRSAFSAILHQGRVAIGTAGTANEQAAGMGIPVVAFPTLGPQYTYANALRQSRLLGKALRLVEPRPEVVAEQVRVFLRDPKALEEARRDGLERNGPPGALPRIAEEISSFLPS